MNTIPSLLLLAAVSFFSLNAAPARTWTDTQGRTIEGELLSVEGEVLLLQMANKKARVTMEQLSESDRAYVQEWLEKKEAEPEVVENAAPAASSKIASILEDKLVGLEGRKVVAKELSSETPPRYYAFYYSAHWCPPCRHFTPELVQFYRRAKKNLPDFELIFFSYDRSEVDMEKYMQEMKMPWMAVRFGDRKRAGAIERYSGDGIPCLVVVDAQGEVVIDGSKKSAGVVMEEFGRLLAKD